MSTFQIWETMQERALENFEARVARERPKLKPEKFFREANPHVCATCKWLAYTGNSIMECVRPEGFQFHSDEREEWRYVCDR